MDDVASVPPQSPEQPHLHRRNSKSTSALDSYSTMIPAASSSSSLPSDDAELLSIKPSSSRSYTSLKDLLPSIAINSSQTHLGSDISIRNRLVKHAAWAYLQPMSTSPGSAGPSFFHRLWTRLAAYIHFLTRNLIHAIDETLRFIST